MSYKSGFFDAIDQGSGDYDRVYNASDFAEYFSRFVGNGVFASPANGLTVESTGGMSLAIKPGYAWINGYLFSVISGTTEALTVPVANPTMNRYDSVVLGLDYQNRQITPYIKSGSPAASPSAASLTRSSSLYEIEIARVYVPTGASYVSQSRIQDMRPDTTRCGFVTGLINQIDTSDLFAQFTAAFNEWFEDLQDTLEGDVAANLLARIQAIEANNCKAYHTSYTGEANYSKSVQLPFQPVRVLITAKKITNGVTAKHELEIYTPDGSTYSGVFTRQSSNAYNLVEFVSVSKISSGSSVTLSWNSGSSTYSCNESGLTYCVTAWGV